MKQEELPKFHETFKPILDILSSGKVIHHRELLKQVIDKYYSGIPKELLDPKTNINQNIPMNSK